MKINQKIYPVYLFYGPEDYLIEAEVQRIMDLALSQKERGMNLHIFNGENHSSQEIVQTAQTLPMFSRYRFVLVKEADRIDKEKIEDLLRYIQNPSPTTCLVLHAQILGLWKKYQKEIEKVGKVMECTRLRGKGLVSWIRRKMTERGKTLSEEAADYLVEVIGDHLHDLENALEKAFLSVGKKQTVELSDIEGIVSEVKISTVYDLTEAIGHQNLEKALGILERIIESKTILFKKDEGGSKKDESLKRDPIPLLLSMMAKQYWNILRVKELAFHQKEAEKVAQELQMSPWSVRKLMDQGNNFKGSSLRDGILKCHQTDLAIKKGIGPKELLMEKLVIDLCRPIKR